MSAEDIQGKPFPSVSPVGLFHADRAGRSLAVNARVCEIAGLAPDTFLGEGWVRALHPDDRERVLKEWRQATQEVRGFESEFRFRRPGGAVVHVLVQALPERDAHGRISGFVGAVTDLSRHLEVQKELRANQERVELALLAATEGCWDWDIATGAVRLSPHWYPRPGDPPGAAQLPVHALIQRIHPEDRSRVRECMATHLEGRTPLYESEHRLLTGSGTWRWNLQRGRVVERDAAGKPLRVVGVGIDIEQRKQAEAESGLRGKQLRRLALQLALAQERERRRIAAGLHDEVGQILAVARAKLGRLMEIGARGDVPGGAGEIRALVDRAIAETRALTFELSSPVLHELGLAAAVESLCERLGKESGVQFRVETDGEPELGEDVRTLLYRAVRVLCQNVVRHARAPHAEVRLHTDGDRIRIVVADDGEGFDACEQARLFDKSGGFGLFALREMCAQVGGRFEIESAAGKGTRAVLNVPLG
ncbi:MAG TPA: PAS domain-containing protein [Myxococcota bacterium]|nr:PAS domain-containing protein [Myxococcota bacterium]